MEKRQKMILIGGSAVLVLLIVVLCVFIFKSKSSDGNNDGTNPASNTQAYNDSLAMVNEQLAMENQQIRLEQEFNQMKTEFEKNESYLEYVQDEELLKKYNESKKRIEDLLKEIEAEKKKGAADNKANQARISQLEAEVSTLRGIIKHYLEEIERLGNENTQLRDALEKERSANADLSVRAETAAKANAALTETVEQAKRLNITSVSLTAYGKKDKPEKNITKAKKLGVSFSVSPNSTTAPGMKTFIVRIVSPEGEPLKGGGTFSFDGATLDATATRQAEYSNDELPLSIYWTANTTLSAGEYLVEVFCDGYRLASKRFTMNK